VTVDVRLVDTARGPVETAFFGAAGPAVLVLHGTPGNYRQALPLGRDLEADYRVLLPSRPGYGRTPLTTGRTPEDQADAYAALLDASGIDAAAVIGISGGGPSAAAFAARYPDRCSALVMVCALVPHLFPVETKLRLALAVPYLWETVGTLARRKAQRKLESAKPDELDAEMRKELTAAELASLDEDPLMRDRLVEFARSHADAPPPWTGFRNDARNIMSAGRIGPHDFAADYAAITAPTLVLGGDSDTVVPPPHADFWASAIPGARFAEITGGGHAFLLTRRMQTMPLLLEHLQDSGRDRAVDVRE
jgi:pimeloyl-ACP methyl ester carboxylesterase